MTGSVKHVQTEEEFRSELSKAGNKLVVIDFYAEWCGPCKFIAPKLAQYSEEYPDVVFIKVDVDALEGISGEFGVRAMPTFIFMKGGNKVADLIGADANRLKKIIDDNK